MNALRAKPTPVTKRDSAISARWSAPAPDGLCRITLHLEDRTMTQDTRQYQKPRLTRFGVLRELTQQIVGHCDPSLSDALAEHIPVCSAR